jgi:endonuclease/exonuclease/phosphatase family metal-dependent hydrolase
MSDKAKQVGKAAAKRQVNKWLMAKAGVGCLVILPMFLMPFAVIILLGFLTGGVANTTESAGCNWTARVMSFNVKGVSYTAEEAGMEDHEDDYSWTQVDDEHKGRGNAVATYVLEAKPDLVGFQENQSGDKTNSSTSDDDSKTPQLYDVLRIMFLGGWDSWTPDKEGRAQPIVWNREKFPELKDKGVIRLNTAGEDGAVDNRYATWVKLKDNVERIWFVVNVHTQAGLDDPEAAEKARKAGYKRLFEGLEKINSGMWAATIMLGDFNSSPSEIKKYMPYDTWLDAAEEGTNIGLFQRAASFNGFGMKVGGETVYKGVRAGSSIDNIYVNKAFEVINWQVYLGPEGNHYTTMVNGSNVHMIRGIYPSDHFPVVSDVILKGCDSSPDLPAFLGGDCAPLPADTEKRLNLNPPSLRVARCVKQYFPETVTYQGGRRAASHPTCNGTGNYHSNHCDGNAVDNSIKDNDSEQGRTDGWKVAKWVQKYAKELGVTQVIWADKHWSPGMKSWKDYKSPNCASVQACSRSDRHLDHVHLSVTPNMDDIPKQEKEEEE